jgi:3-hydroxyisobutyrate dehydrogenase-like beta-hydroxyacid dehydrogenase
MKNCSNTDNDNGMTIGSVQNIGFVDLNWIGEVIADNILKLGFNLVVYNRTPEKTHALVRSEASSAASPKEAAAKIRCFTD